MPNESKKILSEISAGELFDKLSILEIKLDKIKDKNNLKEIKKEYDILNNVKNLNIKSMDKVAQLFKELKKVNINLWNTEDNIRICEKNKDFGQTFIDHARNVYLNNDKRSRIKSKINEVSGSNIKEIKQYVDY